ncbi:MAG: cobyrinate a,c-diamide synthase [Desulfobacterales bacterium]|nr:cobyrinate a,c-diamide synthase [Desulfobacterales bacterium]
MISPSRRIPAFCISGTHSGCGKTTITLGIMAALKKRGLRLAPFKCGPDFIDPSLHRLATGMVSRNLDLWMAGESFVRQCFHHHGAAADAAVIEGVMGLFDGGGSSSAALAEFLDLPVVLVVDARSMAESVAALVHGFTSLEPGLVVAGVICNRVGSERHRSLIEQAMTRYGLGPVLGFIPRKAEFTMPSRHLGLHMAGEQPISDAALERLATTIEQHIDLDGLLEHCQGRVEQPQPRRKSRAVKARIGVARDAAFCFYYQDNLEMLTAAGAELVEFSPLRDQALPEDINALYIGGGYPELHVKELAGNRTMLAAIRGWSRAGRLLYAECGGLIYLCKGIEDDCGAFHPLVNIFPVRARMHKGRQALGYREVRFLADCCWGQRGQTIRGHEFHYSDIEKMPAEVARLYALADGATEGYCLGNTCGSYIHLHLGSNSRAAEWFVGQAEKARGDGR